MFAAIFRLMPGADAPENRRHILFSVKADARTFPADLWERFRAAAERRHEPWIDVLRRLVEAYVAEEPRS